jgi:hypothetical protein
VSVIQFVYSSNRPNQEQDLLLTEPTVFFFSLWVSFSWAVLYLQFGSIPLVFVTNHGFNVEQSGAVFTCMSPPLQKYLLLTTSSHVCWRHHHNHHKHLPRKHRTALPHSAQIRRATALLRVHPVPPHANRFVLVRMDVLFLYSVDCANDGSGMRNHGHLLGLSSNL